MKWEQRSSCENEVKSVILWPCHQGPETLHLYPGEMHQWQWAMRVGKKWSQHWLMTSEIGQGECWQCVIVRKRKQRRALVDLSIVPDSQQWGWEEASYLSELMKKASSLLNKKKKKMTLLCFICIYTLMHEPLSHSQNPLYVVVSEISWSMHTVTIQFNRNAHAAKVY